MAASCRSIKDSVHKIMQVTWWSETPAFDRECVQFAIDVVLEIAQANNMIYKVSTDPSASYSVNEMLLKAFGQMDEATSRLVWLLGEIVADKFIKKCKKLQDHLLQRHEKHFAELKSGLDMCAKKLSAKLVEEPPAKPLPLNDFHKQIAQKDM